jgi:hypothetical protein
MRSRYRERLKVIRRYSFGFAGVGVSALVLADSTPGRIAGGAVSLGGVAAYCFWTVYLNAHPRFSGRQRGLLLALYALGAVAFLSVVGVMVWSIASWHGDWFLWVMVGTGIMESGEHFGVRWVDGASHWRVFGSPRHWLGGAAGVALRRRTNRCT